jgi:deoxyribose-phosphate aldolase
MANPEYSENPDRKYLQKGKHGLAASIRFPKGTKSPAVKTKYPAIAVKKGYKFMKKGA